MMNTVIDTNIVVSAALSPKGNPAKILNFILDNDEMQLFYTTKIFDEYKKVLSYERLRIDAETQNRILKNIVIVGILIEPPQSTIPMPDETDRVFYDTARASGSILITGNTKHYPAKPFIVTATDFLSKLENG